MPHLNKKTWMFAKDYAIIVFGIALYCFAFNAFILPQRVVMGGMAGLGSIVFFFTQRLQEQGQFPWAIPVGVTMYVVNFLLLGLAWRVVDKTFVIRTVFGITVISVMMYIMQPLFTEPILPDDRLLNLVIGSLIMGVGIGLIFIHNGSSGGTDIIAAMVNKKSNLSIGRTMIMCDFVIVGSSFFVLGYGIDIIVYGLLVTFLTGYMCDLIINGNRQAVQFIIFSPDKWQEIATAINNDANRGCTVLNGMGWYTKRETKILLVMCRKIESVTIFRIIKSIDNDALITQANVNGVYGHGFDELKVKIKPKHD